MGYVLLWIENLAAGLLLVATLVACISRLQRPWLRWLLSLLVALPPLIVYGITVVGLGYLRSSELILVGCFYPLVLLTACHAIGVVWIFRSGLRRRGDDPTLAVATAWPRGKLAVVMSIAVGIHMMTWWNLDLTVKQQLAGLQAESGALALSVAPARLPDRDNAALIYEQTCEALNVDSWSAARRAEWERWTDFGSEESDADDPDLRSFLEQQKPTLILLRKAGQKPGCHFGRDYGRVNIATDLTGLAEVRNAARLMALDARYRAAQGDMQTALADVDTMFAMAEHVGGDLFLVSTLVAAAIDAIATETLQEILAVERKLAGDKRTTAEQLQSIDLDGSLSFRRLFSRSLHAEMAAVFNTFHQSSCGDPEWMRFILSHDKNYPDPELYPPIQSFYRVFMATTDVASYRKIMEDASRISAKPYWEAKEEWKRVNDNDRSEPKGLLTAILTPALSRAARLVAHGDARHRTARVALAAACYRAEKGDLPENLAALVPDYTAIVPRDPFDGKPMKYRKTDDGAIIYSIGPDGKDDSGVPWDKDARVGDVMFELKR